MQAETGIEEGKGVPVDAVRNGLGRKAVILCDCKNKQRQCS